MAHIFLRNSLLDLSALGVSTIPVCGYDRKFYGRNLYASDSSVSRTVKEKDRIRDDTGTGRIPCVYGIRVGVEAQRLAARLFRIGLKVAQNILRNTFGMELVELPTRAAAHDSTAGQDKKSQVKAGTQNGEHAIEPQMATGHKQKGACHTYFV